jgi:hypothetical protein
MTPERALALLRHFVPKDGGHNVCDIVVLGIS